MEKLSANAGWLWVKQGFALFRKQPAEFSTLFMSYMLLMVALGLIPLIGQLLPLMLVPVFSIAFMQAGVNIEQGVRVYPNLLLTGFRSPALRSLLILGAWYLIAALLAIAASGLIDGGIFWKVMSGQIELDPKNARDTNISLAMLFSALVYAPAAMAFWYAAPLIAWKDMSVGKAIFYSFFAVKRALGAFIVYGFAWFVIGVLMPAIISVFLVLFFGKAIAVIVLLPLSIMLTVIMYCSFYPTYASVFNKPQPDQPASEHQQ